MKKRSSEIKNISLSSILIAVAFVFGSAIGEAHGQERLGCAGPEIEMETQTANLSREEKKTLSEQGDPGIDEEKEKECIPRCGAQYVCTEG